MVGVPAYKSTRRHIPLEFTRRGFVGRVKRGGLGKTRAERERHIACAGVEPVGLVFVFRGRLHAPRAA
jgi:hypothetical protein